jgi:S1-C subfamily serine protease
VRDRANAEFATAADSLTAALVGLEVDRSKDRPQAGRSQGRASETYRGILRRPETPATGWLISKQGHVLTSWFNVWGEVESIRVLLPGGESVAAEALGHDEYRDLAVVKFDPGRVEKRAAVRPLRLAKRGLQVGDPIGVVGRGPGGGHTLTCGIVSATGRLDGVAVQVDAPVNYGSAGGALLDLDGRCVGVVSHVRTHSPWSQNSGVALAVEAEDILNVLDRLKNGETITKPKRGYIGIRMSSGDLETRGVVVEQVQPDTPAENAGLQARDVIVEVDGERIEGPLDLAKIVGDIGPGTTVTVKLQRGKEALTVEMTLAEHPYR